MDANLALRIVPHWHVKVLTSTTLPSSSSCPYLLLAV